MDSPDYQQVAVMDYLAREGWAAKRDLISFGEQCDLPFVADYEADSRKGIYRRLDSRVLEPLIDQGYIESEQVGRQTRIALTDRGTDTLRAFRYKIE